MKQVCRSVAEQSRLSVSEETLNLFEGLRDLVILDADNLFRQQGRRTTPTNIVKGLFADSMI
jgi:hypothetical protein